jgi:hypothetical protein
MSGFDLKALLICFGLVLFGAFTTPGLAQGSNGDEFTFVRVEYSSGGENFRYRNMFGPYWPSWTVDYPFAERNFMQGLRNLTSLNVAKEPVSLSLLDEEFFRYPFAYLVEPGFMVLTEPEAKNLREWLLRGGFLMVDDFHGPYEWRHFQEQIQKVFTKRMIGDIPLDHPVFHCFYDFDELVQIPGLGSWMRGRTHEKGGFQQHCMGIFDDDGRLMVLVIRNMDMGDAWEHTQDPRYPVAYAAEAYKLGINFVIYALTH